MVKRFRNNQAIKQEKKQIKKPLHFVCPTWYNILIHYEDGAWWLSFSAIYLLKSAFI